MNTRLQVNRALMMITLGAMSAPAWAIGCDELRNSIDARIRTRGVSSFSLTVVSADAAATGGVVGSCELGAMKILYVKGVAAGAAAATTPSPPPAAKPKAAPQEVTECDDGRKVTHGACKP